MPPKKRLEPLSASLRSTLDASKSKKKKEKKEKAPKTPRKRAPPPPAMPLTAWSSSSDDEDNPDLHHRDAGGGGLHGEQQLPLQPVPFYVEDDRPVSQVQSVVDAAAASSSQNHCHLQPGSEAAGAAVLSALLAPLPLRAFFDTCFEERPVLVRRHASKQQGRAVVEGLFGSSDLFDLLQNHDYPYQTGVDVVKFDPHAGVRRTLNSDSAALVRPADLRDALLQGASARILHPQRHHLPLRSVVSDLEGFFGSNVGSNAYISPPRGHQGFAPHFDDVDVFIVQLCGRKRWKAFGPKTEEDVLPRWPSGDFRKEELGPLLLDAVLRRGDVLYLPRGTVHCATTVADEKEKGDDDGDDDDDDGDDDSEEEEEEQEEENDDPDGGAMLPSLHLTISVCQRTTWADFLAVALPRAVELAAASNVQLRRSLPRGLLSSCLGVAREDAAERAAEEAIYGGGGEGKGPVVAGGTARRDEYARRARDRDAAIETIHAAAQAVVAALPIDTAADRITADFLLSRMRPTVPAPPPPPPKKKAKNREGSALLPSLVRPSCGGTAARLCVEGESAVVYHCLANESEAHAAAAGDKAVPCSACVGRVELPLEAAPALELLLGVHSTRPGVDAIRVSDLPGIEDDEDNEETAVAVREALEALLKTGVVVEVEEEERQTKKNKKKKQKK